MSTMLIRDMCDLASHMSTFKAHLEFSFSAATSQFGVSVVGFSWQCSRLSPSQSK